MYALRRHPGFFGLGDIGYSDYMSACTGGGGTGSCSPFDQVCIATQQNVVDACNQQYVTDPTSPHNDPNASTLPAQISPSAPNFDAAVAAAGGSIQVAEQQAGEPVPSDTTAAAWWGAPAGTVQAAAPITYAPPKPPTPSSTPTAPIVTQSAAPPATSPTIVTQSSGAPGGSVVNVGQGQSSGMPSWMLLAAAALVGVLALSKN